MKADSSIEPYLLLGNRYSEVRNYHSYIEGTREKARQAILELTKNAEYIDIPCLCGNKGQSKIVSFVDRWGLPCTEKLCLSCGVLRVSPRWNDNIYFEIYNKFFWKLQSGQESISYERFLLSVERSKQFADYILKNISFEGKRVIEIGCSYGAGLERLKDKGASLVGYDWDQNILSVGRKYTRLDLRYGGVDSALNDYSGRADIVILRHVFEHVLDPITEGTKLKKLLSDGGKLYIEVPGVLNPYEWQPDPFGFFNVFHTFSYSLNTLIPVMNQCGFELISGDEHIHSFWEKTKKCNALRLNSRNVAENIENHIIQMEKERKNRSSGIGRLKSLLKAFLFTHFRVR